MNLDSFKLIFENGVTINTSGSTGEPKEIMQTTRKLQYADEVAIESQKITKDSKIYTVCKIQHAGGLLAQTLPALRIGADVVVEDFSAYRSVSYTHLTLPTN